MEKLFSDVAKIVIFPIFDISMDFQNTNIKVELKEIWMEFCCMRAV